MEGPLLLGGHWVWRDRQEDVQVLFAGRGPDLGPDLRQDRDQVLQRIIPGAPAVAWAKQIHSAHVLPAVPGSCGEGDALVLGEGDRGSAGPAQATGSGGGREGGSAHEGAEQGRPDLRRAGHLALSVVTADCVPVLLAGPGGLAAVHAGWRGIVGGVVPATLGALDGPLDRWTAWIGPSIGPCCYEVGEDVAEQVAAASGPEVVFPGVQPGQRPHLDLIAAVRRQLVTAGVGAVRAISHCTRCDAERLWSYRRDGKGAGRNLALIWRGE